MRTALRRRRAIRHAIVVAGFLLAAFISASPAVAEPLCTDTWTGTTGHWSEAELWSSGHTPSGTDVACVPAGKQVELAFSGETGTTGTLSGAGTVKIDGGELKLENAVEASNIATLDMIGGGTLTGAATLEVTNAINWSNGTMSGTGSTIIKPGATGATAGRLNHRTFINEGSLTNGSTELYLAESSQFDNTGTFTENRQSEHFYEENISIGDDGTATFKNTGTFRRTEGSGYTGIDAPFLNEGTFEVLNGVVDLKRGAISTSTATWSAAKGEHPATIELIADISAEKEAQYEFTGGTMTGNFDPNGSSRLTTTGVTMTNVTLEGDATWNVPSGTETVAGLEMDGGILEGAGTERVTGHLELTGAATAKLVGSGKLIVEKSAAGTITASVERTVINEGTLTIGEAELYLGPNGYFENSGLLIDNYEVGFSIGVGSHGLGRGVLNTGVFERAACGERKCEPHEYPGIEAIFRNRGWIFQKAGPLHFDRLIEEGHSGWGCTRENPSYPKREYAEDAGVCTATGDLSETQTDLAIGGKGIGLNVDRTYNSQRAEKESKAGKPKGMFGYGWSSPYTAHVVAETEYSGFESEFEEEELLLETHYLTFYQENGASVEFFESAPGVWQAPPGCPDIVTGSAEAGYTIKLEDQETYTFSGATGRMESQSDRYGNVTHFKYNAEGHLESVEDPGKRLLKFGPYNSEGLVETIEDPMGHHIAYHYAAGELTEVSQRGEPEKARWKFEYGEAAQLTQIENAIGGQTKIAYSAGRVAKKTDPVGNTLKYEYLPDQTTITNETTKAVTIQYTTSQGTLAAVSRAVGTPIATTESFSYDKAGDQTAKTDGDGNTWHYEYDGSGNKTQEEDPEGHKTKWTYNGKHDIETETLPDGETTTYKLNATTGNPEAVERPAPKGETQTTKYTYFTSGLVETTTDPAGRTTKYSYDAAGDKTAETDAEGDKTGREYNADSEETSMIAPDGYALKKESKYTTTYERNVRGQIIKATSPLTHETKYAYDGDGNRTEETDPLGNITKITYNANNQPIKQETPEKALSETEYDGAGAMIKMIDGNKHATVYARNALEQVETITDPLGRKTTNTYDHAGHMIETTDALGRTTERKYTSSGRLAEIKYSDGKTHSITYTYNGDGARVKMIDATGTTTYERDQLDRIEKTTDGNGDSVSYTYNLAGDVEAITYPNGKAVKRSFNSAGRLSQTEDWEKSTTKFGYDATGNLTSITYPSASSDVDTFAYDETGAMKEATYTKGVETIAAIAYTRNKDSQVTKEKQTGLMPGEELPAYTYDTDSRLTKGRGLKYKYDSAGQPTEVAGVSQTFDAAGELEKHSLDLYTYNEVGDRTKLKPHSGATTTYGYDQADRLITVSRPAAGEIPAIEDEYTYTGDGLRASQKIGATTTHDTWDEQEQLPLLLDDGTMSYVYGPGSLPIEQVPHSGSITYLHHDQQGSIRLITSTAGAVVGGTAYDSYGNVVGRTGTTVSAFGYDGQYTDSDTGLVYLRARYYDPTTAQFMTTDPLTPASTGYLYADSNPLAKGDPSGAVAEFSDIYDAETLENLADTWKDLAGNGYLFSAAVVLIGRGNLVGSELADGLKAYADWLIQWASYLDRVAWSLANRQGSQADHYALKYQYVTIGSVILPIAVHKHGFCWYRGPAKRSGQPIFWCGGGIGWGWYENERQR